MLIQVYDGIVEADDIVALTPVIKQSLTGMPGQSDVKMIDKPLYMYQITLSGGARINCTYEEKIKAEEERYFVLESWMAVKNQGGIATMESWKKFKEAEAEKAKGEQSNEQSNEAKPEQSKEN